jgi:hypothetical protein
VVYIAAFLVANVILFLLYVYLIKRPSEEKQALRRGCSVSRCT